MAVQLVAIVSCISLIMLLVINEKSYVKFVYVYVCNEFWYFVIFKLTESNSRYSMQKRLQEKGT